MDVVTSQERGLRQTDDEILPAAASDEVRLLLTNDADFLRIHSEGMAAGPDHAGLVFWPQDRPIGDVVPLVHQDTLQTSSDAAVNLVKFA